jgi:DNA-binding transcriptional ArsR family regulator
MTEVMTDVAENGVAPASARERIAHDLEEEIAQLLRRERQLELELAEVKSDRRTFEQSLMRLRGEPLVKHPGKGRPKSLLVRPNPSKVGPEPLAEIEQVIRDFAADHDEFRQVDIRSRMTGGFANSSKMSSAFEQLRQEGVIRFARRDGIQKFYRLTATSLREGEREATVGPERMGEIEQVVREMFGERDEINYAELMERIGISHSGASYAMTRLEERGIVESRRGGGIGGGVKLFRLVDEVSS